MKKIIAATAASLMLSTAAFAESQTGSFSMYEAEQSGDIYASNFIGMRVYSAEKDYDSLTAESRVEAGAETEWDDIGEVNDVILGPDGQVKAAILGVGGFIGLGEKDVAVNMDSLKLVAEKDDEDDFFIVVNTTKQQLTEAPEYSRLSESEMAEANSNDDAAMEQTAESVEQKPAEQEKMAANSEMKTEEPVATQEIAAVEERPGTPFTAPNIEREGYETARVDELTTEDLTGARIYGVNDEDIGEIDKLIMGDSKELKQAILDVGGFLGIGEHRVAVSMDELRIIRNAEGGDVRVYLDASQEELEAQPEYNG